MCLRGDLQTHDTVFQSASRSHCLIPINLISPKDGCDETWIFSANGDRSSFFAAR